MKPSIIAWDLETVPQLITSFCNKMAELCPQLITFNGSSFDLPVQPSGKGHTSRDQ